MTTLPTIVLVHGAWHQPANYQTFIDALTSAGFSVHTPRLPSCTNDYATPPNVSTPEDVRAVNAIIKEHVEAGKKVLMVMHSYGGLVGTDAITDDLLRTNRAANGQPGGVINLLYLCAYMLQSGTSVIDICKAAGIFPAWSQFVTNYDDGSTFPVDPNISFFSGESEPGILEHALLFLVRSPLSAFNAPAQRDTWKKLPVTYVHTLKDYAVPMSFQTIMVELVEKEGVRLAKKTFDTSHSLFITEEKEIVNLVLEVAKDGRNPQ
ncbi:alpha/beta-hydrolase [Byssothecium circinans]|uniref:Alpha/beta-hydrolase n=1 Tax=Byssothecium circinans TaxID=147558 RepID=A0A6A5U046_9PLEO|nr:alpha/beta-hydrolase [Byssothecium circinans]